MPTNKAAWLPFKQARPYEINDAPMPVPNADQIIIKAHAVAINPADAAVQDLGVVYETYPIVPGCDVAGEVVELGSNVSDFQLGDRVIASLYSGAFQLYCAANPPFVAKIPGAIEFTQACVLPLAFVTAAVCLFEEDMLALQYPGAAGEGGNGELLFVWGGSSALGSCAIQQAKAAGYDVATTAREHNFEYCKQLGAKYVFDYTSPAVVDGIIDTLKGAVSAGVFCPIIAEGVVGQCARISDRLAGRRFISVVYSPVLQIPDRIPEGVKIGQCWHAALTDSTAAKYLFGSWLPTALANGAMKCLPAPEVVGRGLESIQGAVDKVREGVSAKKMVVELS